MTEIDSFLKRNELCFIFWLNFQDWEIRDLRNGTTSQSISQLIKKSYDKAHTLSPFVCSFKHSFIHPYGLSLFLLKWIRLKFLSRCFWKKKKNCVTEKRSRVHIACHDDGDDDGDRHRNYLTWKENLERCLLPLNSPSLLPSSENFIHVSKSLSFLLYLFSPGSVFLFVHVIDNDQGHRLWRPRRLSRTTGRSPPPPRKPQKRWKEKLEKNIIEIIPRKNMRHRKIWPSSPRIKLER